MLEVKPQTSGIRGMPITTGHTISINRNTMHVIVFLNETAGTYYSVVLIEIVCPATPA